MPGTGGLETPSEVRAGAHAPAGEGEMPGAQRPSALFADTEPVGGALSPVFVPDPARQHGERSCGDGDAEHTSARPGGVDEAVSVQRFFQQELAEFGHDLTVRRGTVRHEDVETELLSVEPRFMLHPGDPRRMFWDLFCMTLLVYSVINVPLQVAFEDSSQGCSSSFAHQHWMFYVDMVVDFAFMFDLLLNLRTAYWHPAKKATLVTDQKSIFINYAKGFFWIDLMGAFPVDLIMLGFCAEGNATNANNLLRAPKIIKQLRLLRALRLLRVSRFKRMVDRVRDYLNISPGYLRLLQLSVVIFLVFHYDACIMYWIGANNMSDPEDETGPQWDTWVSSNDYFGDSRTGKKQVLVKDLDANQAYLIAFYWAWTTVMTVGFGDVTPVTTAEAGFTIFVVIQGGCALGYVVGSFADMVSRINMRRKRYRELCEQWDSIFHQGSFPPVLRKRIREFNYYKYIHPAGTLSEYVKEKLSKELLREITAHVYKDSLTSLPFFRQVVYADHACATELALSLRHVQMPPLELIYHEEEEGSKMFFLSRGSIQMSIMLVPDNQDEFWKKIHGYTLDAVRTRPGKKIMKLVKGDQSIECPVFNWVLNETTCSHFGESVLFSHHNKRLATAMTQTEATLLTLSWDSIEQVSQKYEAARKLVQIMKRGREPTLARLVRAMIQVKRAKLNPGAQLKIVVHGAESLPKMDATAKCDPFVDLALNDEIDPSIKNRSKSTIVCQNTYSPAWNQTFTFSLKHPELPRAVDVRFSVFDYDVLSQPDLAGFCTYDVSTLLKECMQQQGEVVLEQQWIPLMIERHSLLGRLRGELDLKLCPVRGVDGKPSRICCTISCSPPEDQDHQAFMLEQSKSMSSIMGFRKQSRLGMNPGQGKTRKSSSPRKHAMKKRTWARSVKLKPGERDADQLVDEITHAMQGGDSPASPGSSDSDDETDQDPAAQAPCLVSRVQEKARLAMQKLSNTLPYDPDTDPAVLLHSAMEAWSHVETLSAVIQEDSASTALEMKQLTAKLQEMQDLVAGAPTSTPSHT